MKIKVCGMRDTTNIQSLAALKPDYIGFIFYKDSKRFAGNLGKEVVAKLPVEIKKTGVFVNTEIDEICKTIDVYQLSAVQLHGAETPDTCRFLKDNKGIDVIKAFGVDDDLDFRKLSDYVDSVDYFLFDTHTKNYGGSGKMFNWNILKRYLLDKPYFLSGGIGLENISQVIQLSDPRLYAVDLNSRFEIQPGVKDVNNIKQAIGLIRNNI